jgi:hypothetical protein
LRQRQAGGVVERDAAAVGHHAIDELHLLRLEGERTIAFIECVHVGVGQPRDHAIEDVVLVHGDDAEPPTGGAEIFRIRIDADGVVR